MSHLKTIDATASEFRVGQEVLIEGKTRGWVVAKLPHGLLLVRTATELVPLPPVLLAPARGAGRA